VWKIAKLILHPKHNPLRYAPTEYAYMATLILACFWCLAFGLYMGELVTIGHSMLGHIAIITMVFVTFVNISMGQKKIQA
jgi:hypothetical protein